MIFDFKCSACGTAFSMGAEYLIKREKVCCPTCDLQFDETLFKDLKELATSHEKFSEGQRSFLKKIGLSQSLFVSIK